MKLYLRIREERRGGYGHIYCEPVIVDGDGDKVQYVSDQTHEYTIEGGRKPRLPYLAGFRVSCQMGGGITQPSYGWRAQYEAVDVTEDSADVMNRTLKSLRKVQDKLYEQFGTVSTFGDFAVRTCMGLKCSGFVEETQYGVRFWTTGDAKGRIDSMIFAFHEEQKNQAHS